MKEIRVVDVILNYFYHYPNLDSITFQKIGEIKRKAEKHAFDSSSYIYIPYHRDVLTSMSYTHGDILTVSFDEEIIHRNRVVDPLDILATDKDEQMLLIKESF